MLDSLLKKYSDWDEEFLEKVCEILYQIFDKRENISVSKLAVSCLCSLGKFKVLKSKVQFWEKLWVLLIKMISTESSETVELVDSVACMIGVYYGTLKMKKTFTSEMVQTILESNFYGSSEFCSNDLLLLLLHILSNNEIRELSKIIEIKKNLLNWIINSFSIEKCRNDLNPEIVAIAISSLCMSNDALFFKESPIVKPIGDSKLNVDDIESQLGKFKYLENPLLTFNESDSKLKEKEKDFFEPQELNKIFELKDQKFDLKMVSFLFKFLFHFLNHFPSEILLTTTSKLQDTILFVTQILSQFLVFKLFDHSHGLKTQ
jgi:hypothetical protein